MKRARTVFLIRHGETDWNAQGRWQGHTDIPLNDAGRRQAAAAAEMLGGTKLAGVVSSDLARANETASIIVRRLALEISYTDPELRERFFGIFEGLTRDECARLHGDAWRAWMEEQLPPPGGEGRELLANRVTRAIGTAATRVPGDGPVLVVSHGGSIRAAIAGALGETVAPVANCSVWQLHWDGAIIGAHPL